MTWRCEYSSRASARLEHASHLARVEIDAVMVELSRTGQSGRLVRLRANWYRLPVDGAAAVIAFDKRARCFVVQDVFLVK